MTSTMMEDDRGTKLSSNLKAAFLRDPDIDEYDFLPVLEPTHNCNPLVLIDHKLGLELWAVKVLFDYAYNKVINWRRKLSAARGLESGELVNLTRAVLMINPDCVTAWNIRKELIEAKGLSVVDDVRLGTLILTKHPKSPETFAHRKWLLLKTMYQLLKRFMMDDTIEQNSNTKNCKLPGTSTIDAVKKHWTDRKTLPTGFPSSEPIRALVETEMTVCELAAAKYSNNYNAWSHRTWVLQYLTANDKQVLTSELQKTEKWTCNHISDHSGFHYRQYLLTYLGLRTHHLESELAIVTNLILSFSGHESLWNHRRFIVQALVSKMSAAHPEKTSESQVAKKTKVIPQRTLLLEQEADFSSQVLRVSPDGWQQMLAKAHRTWLTRAFGDTRER